MRRASRSAALLAALLGGGCATVTTLQAEQGRHFSPYSGTRLDLRAIDVADRDDTLRRLSYVDLPASFALDTLLLPVSVLVQVLPDGVVYRPAP